MPEKEELCKIWAITDDDTGMYYVGEVDGLFDRETLKQYLKTQGEEGKKRLLTHLGHLSYSVVDEWNRINEECAAKHTCAGAVTHNA